MKASSIIVLRNWINSHGKQRPTIGYLAVLASIYLGIILSSVDNLRSFDFHPFHEVYSYTTIIHGVIFGIFSSHFVSRWWDLRLATGTVAGALADIAMILNSCVGEDASEELALMSRTLAGKLKHIHLLHLCDIMGVDVRTYCTKPLCPITFKSPGRNDIIYCLCRTMEEASKLISKSSISDSMKFSSTSAIQADLSSIRSSSGDCSMILNTQQPRRFTIYVWIFTLFHLSCAPLYFASQSSWNPMVIIVGTIAAVALIGGFIMIIVTDFRNPFLNNTFKLERIVDGTFRTIDDCLMGTSKTKQTSNRL